MNNVRTVAAAAALALSASLGIATSTAHAQAYAVPAPRYYYPTAPSTYRYYYPTAPAYYGAPRTVYTAPYRYAPAATGNSVGGHNRDYSRGWDLPLAKPWLKPLR